MLSPERLRCSLEAVKRVRRSQCQRTGLVRPPRSPGRRRTSRQPAASQHRRARGCVVSALLERLKHLPVALHVLARQVAEFPAAFCVERSRLCPSGCRARLLPPDQRTHRISQQAAATTSPDQSFVLDPDAKPDRRTPGDRATVLASYRAVLFELWAREPREREVLRRVWFPARRRRAAGQGAAQDRHGSLL
jgi:hypothetical protein